ncbi:hypothetical protein KFK09_010074 [Dendrobium nobile]|uniref:Uncharacterized protein n=1 Tax=Dendrobium nobile TaxID=94219 RepID=A0A8T3BJQ0_DENNO|nr:hypothetical protein KFK09_010074 [Dendrobium nobile]
MEGLSEVWPLIYDHDRVVVLLIYFIYFFIYVIIVFVLFYFISRCTLLLRDVVCKPKGHCGLLSLSPLYEALYSPPYSLLKLMNDYFRISFSCWSSKESLRVGVESPREGDLCNTYQPR